MACESLSMMSLEENYVMVAAIDFGTTFSGYAFSFKTNKEKIMMNKSWGGNVGFQSYKTPTCLMVDSSNRFHAFGYDAEEKYSHMSEEDGDLKSYQLFRHFKMMLHDEKITKYNTIPSIDGKMMSALEIFAMALRYLKDHLIDVVSQQAKGASTSMIRWVITVPAIWTEEAKQFMREAAYMAGIIPSKDSRQLLIALEPEAASIYCRSMEVNQFIEPSGLQSLPSFRAGTKYLVIDAGGGTVDLTAHEILSSGKVKEIHTASGGPWGGTKVDENFIKLLEEVLESDFIQAFQQQCPQQWLLFLVSFERVKRSAKPDGVSKISISIPFGMATKYPEICGKGLDKAIKQAGKPGLSFSNGLLILQNEVVASLFQPVISSIVTHIDSLMSESAMSGCSQFMLVGGFAESPFLQKAITDRYKTSMSVLVPEEAQMSVIKGAVLFGHRPDDIQVRKARYTYGICINEDFNSALHHEKYKIFCEGRPMCDKVFDKFILKNDDVEFGKTVNRTYGPSIHYQIAMDMCIWQSDNTKVKYTDEVGCRQLGSITIQMPNVQKGMYRTVEAKMVFGGTEIQIHACDVESGCTAETVVDFLGD